MQFFFNNVIISIENCDHFMKFIYYLFGISNVSADTASDFCNNENLISFINIVSAIINLIKIGVSVILVV